MESFKEKRAAYGRARLDESGREVGGKKDESAGRETEEKNPQPGFSRSFLTLVTTVCCQSDLKRTRHHVTSCCLIV